MPEGQPREVIRSAANFKRVITAGGKPGHHTVVHLLLYGIVAVKRIDHSGAITSMINPAA